MATRDKERPPAIDYYRNLWANIRFSRMEGPLKTILVTSSMDGEGKSTLLANLGMVIAQAGKRVLLLDTDLRAPDLHKLFRVKREPGITGTLRDIFEREIKNGLFEEISPAEYLRILKLQARTGYLTFESNDESLTLTLDRGTVVDTSWQNRPLTRRLGNLLLRDGKITGEQLQEALNRQDQNNSSLPLGHIMIKLGYIAPADIKGPCQHQISEAITYLMRWREGRFYFQEGEDVTYEKEVINLLTDPDPFSPMIEPMAGGPYIETSLSRVIQPTIIDNLWVMPSGPLPPNPTAILESAG